MDLLQLTEEASHYNGSASRFILFNEHSERAVHLAYSLYGSFPGSMLLDRKDFAVIALAALWKSTEHYEPDRGATFWTYALRRVRGSILDEIRKNDHLSRHYRDRLTDIRHASELLAQKLGREVSLEEAGSSIGMEADELTEIREAASFTFISLDATADTSSDEKGGPKAAALADIIEDPNYVHPGVMMDFHLSQTQVEDLLDKLPAMERSIIRLYFWSGISLKNIAKSMCVSESRVSQRLAESLEKLKNMVKKHEEEIA